MKRQKSFFENTRSTMADSLDMTAASLNAYAANYRHWAIAYSGGKDSSALVTVVLWLIAQGRIPTPETLTVLYSDTRQEIPPLLHWRVCHVWDWLMFEAPVIAPSVSFVAQVYGGEEAQEINARTGCIGCPLATRDTALDHVLTIPEWTYLQPLKRLRPLYTELRSFRHRKQKDGERNKDGNFSSHPSRKGPLTLATRVWALGEILTVQNEINASAVQLGRPLIDLINAEEESRIRELIALRTYPQRWSDADPDAMVLISQTYKNGDIQNVLPLLQLGGSDGTT